MTAAAANWRSWSVEEKTRLRWRLQARPDQLAPDGDWHVWLILAGRGWGKTRTGAEWLASQAISRPGSRWAVVAPTFADARDTCVEGESGLLAVLAHAVGQWNRSLGELTLRNTSRIKLFSADEPERLRGPQHHGAWCDEPASWRYAVDAWDQLQFGLRLGDHPRTVVTGTPKPVPLIRDLVKRDTTHVTRGSTFDNAANLAPAALAELRNRYEGTRLGRQELHAELLEDVEGALVTRPMIDACRVTAAPNLARVVVALDPSDGDADSDEQAITVAGVGDDARYYVLHSEGVRVPPYDWLRRAANLFEHFAADRVVYEKNHGGRFLTDLFRQVAPELPATAVVATHGKRTRFEPVAALYEQGRVSHVGTFPELEDQLCSFTGAPGEVSPDRLDATVWALSELSLGVAPRRLRFRGAAA